MENKLFQDLLQLGTSDYYQHPDLYNYDYRNRQCDVKYYKNIIKILGQNQPMNILELGCGTGRILVPLLRDGHKLVGIDLSLAMLKKCKSRVQRVAKEKQKNVLLTQANFLNLPLSNPNTFSFILCTFNTFMHLYTRKEVEHFLFKVKSLLMHKGYFLFDVLNPNLAWLNRDSNKRWSKTKFFHPTTRKLINYSTNHIYDAKTQILFMNLFYDSGERASVYEKETTLIQLTHRQFFPEELEALLTYNGFTIEKRYGDFEGSSFSSESEQQVIIARPKH